ncbi:MAG: hypothetical protein RhofKO_07020 [Rhodothermales bacterium]
MYILARLHLERLGRKLELIASRGHFHLPLTWPTARQQHQTKQTGNSYRNALPEQHKQTNMHTT